MLEYRAGEERVVESIKDKVAYKRKACATFFEMMGDSFVYDS